MCRTQALERESDPMGVILSIIEREYVKATPTGEGRAGPAGVRHTIQ